MSKHCNYAQGSLEYLLMIGAAVLIVAVVIIAMSGLIVDTKDQNAGSDYDNQMDKLNNLIKKPGSNNSLDSIASIFYFSINNVSGTIQGNEITILVPPGTDLSNLAPDIRITGSNITPASGVAQDFSSPIDYNVVSKDLNSFTIYTVRVITSTITDNRIKLTTCVDLNNVRNNLDGNYVLLNDIDCSDTINWSNGLGFEPIGSIQNLILV